MTLNYSPFRPLLTKVAIEVTILILFLTVIPADAQKRAVSRSAPSRTGSKTVNCDSLAAHPDDKGRVGTGVVDSKLQFRLAIPKCLEATEAEPEQARLHFQLGRAYWAGKKYDEALDSFLKAEEMAYAPAYFYLGQAYEKGMPPIGKADAITARNLYLIAASENFKPAVSAYQNLIGDMPDFSEFKQPGLMQALYEGDVGSLNKDIRNAVTYGIGIQNFIAMDDNDYDPTCGKIADGATNTKLTQLMYVEILDLSPNPSLSEISSMGFRTLSDFAFVERVQKAASVREDGTNDIYLLSYDYGGCDGEAVQKVYSTLQRFAKGSR